MTAPARGPAEALLRLEGVTKDYGSSVVTRVLKGIDLIVHPGEFLPLTGPLG